MRWCLALTLLCLPVAAQEYLGVRDFLTEHEADVIRQTQESPDRIAAYTHFATLRLELVDQLLAKEQAGRGAKIHRNLEDYGRILEAIDMVVDDALLRDRDLAETIGPLVEAERGFLARLEKIEQADSDDLWRYEFVLEDALDITADSLELSEADLDDRKRDIIDSDGAEKAARERTMTDARRKDVDKAKKKTATKEAEHERKRPSLLGSGENLDEANDKVPKKKR